MIQRRAWAGPFLAAAGFLLSMGPRPAFATAVNTGSTTGVFTNPVLAGNAILVDNTQIFLDNTSGAVYSGFGTNAIQWGSYSGPPTSAPDHSSLTFVGADFAAEPPGVPFRLGTLTYTNGTSDSNTGIFGGTLIISAARAGGLGLPISDSTDNLVITGTQNGHANPAQDADFIFFPLLNLSFDVLEGKTATADIYGEVVGDPQLVLTGIVATSPDGFIGNGAADFAPEPGTFGILMAGLGGLLLLRSRARQRSGIAG
jgi:hypothetical protein